ncbi:MAG: UDP-N-acetylmuramoyl-L-alanyl-D-glutamate--2,6-diaminopimelate ligase [Desulfobacterales bacterium]|nr:UDP-N-acetylmuramoyl-L-alanyl-D-glutamate--2,6-diaminopimelate ligase [Desulfobacterales bacterium]
MQLNHLLKAIPSYDFKNGAGREIKGIAYDSRAVKPGYLFVALKGNMQDGHNYFADAIQNGAVALIGENFKGIDGEIAMIQVRDSRAALSKLAARFYGYPSSEMNMIGITGTNGKTTTSYILESILSAANATPGVLGTINYRLPGQVIKAPMTTPESLDLMRILRKMADGGVTDVSMEVSSHALDQGRVADCPFRIAVFTNISRDHLDYHKSMKEYFNAKSLLFKDLGEKGPDGPARAVINIDDPKGEELIELTDAPVMTYGLSKECDVRAEYVHAGKAGITAIMVTPSGKTEIRSSLIGGFNIYNILAASAASLCLDIDLDAVRSGIAQLKGVPGRLELVSNISSCTVVVDYAHTPDALLKVLKSVESLSKGRLITVFGCGGDRDKGKRKEMGRVAGEESDLVFITSDNPRTEDPVLIISQIEEGIRESGLEKMEETVEYESHAGVMGGYILNPDRHSAILSALRIAEKEDLILIAGKGHEDYQIIGKEKRYFDDRKVVEKAALERPK